MTADTRQQGYLLELYETYRFVRHKRRGIPTGFHVATFTNVARSYPSSRSGPSGRYKPWVYIAPFVRKSVEGR